MSKISLIIPTYFNEETIEKLKSDLIFLNNNLKEKKITLEIIFIDDASKDATLKHINNSFQKFDNITILQNQKNIGTWRSIKLALNYVQGDAFVFMAADRQDPIDIIIDLIDEWKKGEKIVIAERNNRVETYFSKTFANFFVLIVRKLFFDNFPKHGYDTAIIDKKYLELFNKPSDNYYIPFEIFWLGFNPKRIYYTKKQREFGKSKYTLKKKLDQIFDIFFSYSKTPIRIFIYFGFLISFLSFIYGFYVIFIKLAFGNPVPGFTSIVALVSLMSGILIGGLGLALEYLSRIYNKVQKNDLNKNIKEIFRSK